jgi:hypothetical protein
MVTKRASASRPASLPRDPDALYARIHELYEPLNAKRVDHAALRNALPKATATTRKLRGELEGAVVVAGSAVAEDGLALAENALLVVLGDLAIRGGLYSPLHVFSLVLVGGKLTADRMFTSGDVIAFGGLTATLYWAVGNDYATYAPVLVAGEYLAEDRHDVVGERRTEKSTVGRDLDAKLRKRFANLDPTNDDSIRAFIGGPTPAPTPKRTISAAERAALEAQLAAAWKIPDRVPKVAAIRAVYASIKKRRLADCGDLLVTDIVRARAARPKFSIQDALELLAALGRDDLLLSIPTEHLEGYADWMPNLLKIARRNR